MMQKQRNRVTVIHPNPEVVTEALANSGLDVHILSSLGILSGEVVTSLTQSSVVIIQTEFYLNSKKTAKHASALLRDAGKKGSRIVFLYADDEVRNEIVRGGVSGEFFYSESYFLFCPEVVLSANLKRPQESLV